MPSNVPWHIIHVHAEADPATIALPTLEPGGMILIFFWKSNHPVGHRIVGPQEASPTTPTILEWARSHLGEYLDTSFRWGGQPGGIAPRQRHHSDQGPARRPGRCLRSFQTQTARRTRSSSWTTRPSATACANWSPLCPGSNMCGNPVPGWTSPATRASSRRKATLSPSRR